MRICVEAYSFRNNEGILLYLLVFCFRYGSVVYTVMMLANSRCAVKDRKCLLMLRVKQMYNKNSGNIGTFFKFE